MLEQLQRRWQVDDDFSGHTLWLYFLKKQETQVLLVLRLLQRPKVSRFSHSDTDFPDTPG